MQDIKSYFTFTKIEPVNKGWSSDKKHYIETADGRKLLLRVADISEYDRKKAEFEMIKQVGALAFYISSNTLSSICCTMTFGEKEITTMKNQARDVLSWFDNLNNTVPTWYKL